MNFVLTGSLGNIGLPLTKTLLSRGHRVTVISSRAETQKQIEELGAQAAIGDILNTDFLTATFSGADAVYCMAPQGFMGAAALDTSYATAIKQSRVKRVVHLSSWGAHLPAGIGFISDKYVSEKSLDSIEGISVTHIRPASFYYNLFMHLPAIKGAGFMVANYGEDDKTVLVAPEDIADAVSEELEKQTSEAVRYVASEELTCNEIAQILGEAIGKPSLQWLRITDAQMNAALQVKGLPPFVAGKLTELYAAHRTGLLAEDFDKHKPALGKIKLRDFAPEFAARFQKP